MNHLERILSSLADSVPALVYAIALLVLALVVAIIVKKIVVKLCRRLNLGKKLEKYNEDDSGETGETTDFVDTIGKIAFVLVFVLFLPGILDTLNLHGVSQPIMNMMNDLFGYLPNIIGAIAIFVIGNMLAKVVKQIVVSLLRRVKFDKLQEKIGIKAGESTIGFSALVGNVIYGFILIFVTIAALEVLDISAISDPAAGMLADVLSMVPNVFTATILIVVGVYVGRLVGTLLSALLSGLGVNGLFADTLKSSKPGGKEIIVSDIIGGMAKFIVVLLFAVQAFSVLRLAVFNDIGEMIIAYLPNIIGALLVLGIGVLLAKFAGNAMGKHTHSSALKIKLVKTAIITMTIFMTLNQLRIAEFIVNTTFIVVLGAAAVACVLAFGIGGRDIAASILANAKESLEEKIDDKASEDLAVAEPVGTPVASETSADSSN